MKLPLAPILIAALTAPTSAQPGLQENSNELLPSLRVAWKSVKAEPGWFSAPPQGDAIYRFATVRRSNLLSLAMERASRLAPRDVRAHLREQLAPVLSFGLAKTLADHAASHVRGVEGATMFGQLVGKDGKPARGPGNTLATAWVLWEVPHGKLLPKSLSRQARKAALRVLARAPTPWRDVDAAPNWVKQPKPRAGWCNVVLDYQAEWHRGVRKLAAEQASAGILAELLRRISPFVDEEVAGAAALTGVHAAVAVARAMRFRKLEKHERKGKRRYETTAWVHWQVPLEAVLRKIPDARRAAVRKVLAHGPTGK